MHKIAIGFKKLFLPKLYYKSTSNSVLDTELAGTHGQSLGES